jgi:hypothetical protein
MKYKNSLDRKGVRKSVSSIPDKNKERKSRENFYNSFKGALIRSNNTGSSESAIE